MGTCMHVLFQQPHDGRGRWALCPDAGEKGEARRSQRLVPCLPGLRLVGGRLGGSLLSATRRTLTVDVAERCLSMNGGCGSPREGTLPGA